MSYRCASWIPIQTNSSPDSAPKYLIKIWSDSPCHKPATYVSVSRETYRQTSNTSRPYRAIEGGREGYYNLQFAI